ncbi:dTDP-4-dehydrorhamnose 3,5-epimerase [Rhodobacteraceae bacterium CCMM004]|nr:dTDP-4-dehydrorhamnose 3,5-epimerase [Rhodobacteraceae bacterium CCMM004]
MQTQDTALDGVQILTPRRFDDPRGHFHEVWSPGALAMPVAQINQSFNRVPGTLRGLHCQAPPRAQAKLVYVPHGAIWDVAVDARRGSPTYGRWTAAELSAETGRQLFVPAGFLHGFVTLVPETVVAYLCGDGYAPDCERSVRWDDPDLAIDWPLPQGGPTVSGRDAGAESWAAFDTPFSMDPRP